MVSRIPSNKDTNARRRGCVAEAGAGAGGKLLPVGGGEECTTKVMSGLVSGILLLRGASLPASVSSRGALKNSVLFLALLFFLAFAAAGETDALTMVYEAYNGTEGFGHWLEYGKAYHENLHHLHARSHLPGAGKVKVFEIGVQSGGSSRIWRRYFGSSLSYVGLDINDKCLRFESPELGIHIEIGSQSNATLLKEICSKYGPFDLIVDDGAHQTSYIMASLNALWPDCLLDEAVYCVEDLHTMAMSPDASQQVDGLDVYGHLARLSRDMVRYFYKSKFGKFVTPPDPFAKYIQSIKIYDSLACLHHRKVWRPITPISKGNFIAYTSSGEY